MWNLLIPAISTILGKVLPDAGAADAAKLKLLELAQAGQLAELNAVTETIKAQLAVNQAEASSGNPYAASWRPTIGYVCAAALAWTYVFNPIIMWAVAIWKPGMTLPNITIDDHLWELMMGMLGLAGWRTLDKVKGVA